MNDLGEAITKQIYLCRAIGRSEALWSRQPSARWSREKTDRSDTVSQTENVCPLQTLLLNAGGIKERQEEQRKRRCLRVRSDAILLEVTWQPVVEHAGVAGNLVTHNLLPCLTEVEHLAHNLENKLMAR
jgi:hypothetical protein